MTTKTLSDYCEPVFLFLTTFHRQVGTRPMSIEEVRNEARRVLRDQKTTVLREAQPLYRQYELAEKLLIYAIDGIVRNSSWDEAPKWDYNTLEKELLGTANQGGSLFFASISLPEYDDPQLAEIAFTCLGLGFRGAMAGSPETLRRERERLYSRLANVPRGDGAKRITPACYENDIRSKPVLPAVKTARLVACLVGVVILLVVIQKLLFEASLGKIEDAGAHVVQLHREKVDRSPK